MERISRCDMNLAAMAADIDVDIIILVLVQTVMRIDMFVCRNADDCMIPECSSAEMQTLATKMIFRLPRSHPATVIRCRRYEDIDSSVCKFCPNLQIVPYN